VDSLNTAAEEAARVFEYMKSFVAQFERPPVRREFSVGNKLRPVVTSVHIHFLISNP